MERSYIPLFYADVNKTDASQSEIVLENCRSLAAVLSVTLISDNQLLQMVSMHGEQSVCMANRPVDRQSTYGNEVINHKHISKVLFETKICNVMWHSYTVKPVCNDHLYNKIYYLWFIQ